jgi:type II secretory pathway pseudopilin PulG
MPLRSRPSSFPSGPEAPAGQPCARGRGYAFLILMMLLTLLLIALTAAVPDIMTQGRREREKELIFRGEQYARAIALFHRQFNRYPTSIKELLKRTNGYRFLRHAYPDPMTRSGKWRLIHATAAGVVLDSKTLAPPGAKKGAKPGGQGQPGENGAAGQGTESQPAGNGQAAQGAGPASENGEQPTSQLSGSAGMGMQGAFIVGVASTSTKKSIRVYNDQESYDKWEFLGLPTNTEGGAVAPPAAGQPTVPSPHGAGMQTNPTGMPSSPP